MVAGHVSKAPYLNPVLLLVTIFSCLLILLLLILFTEPLDQLLKALEHLIFIVVIRQLFSFLALYQLILVRRDLILFEQSLDIVFEL
jgi:hypothetical protein